MPAVCLGKRTSVGLGSLDVLRLEPGRCCVLFAGGNPLLGSGNVLNALGTAVVGNMPFIDDSVSFHNRPVYVGVVDVSVVYAHDRGVISEVVAAPLAA
jgi:hypothetical protein